MFPLAELSTTAIRILCRELGPANTARFLSQFTTGFGNYTEERDAIVGAMTFDEIVEELQQRSEGSGQEDESGNT